MRTKWMIREYELNCSAKHFKVFERKMIKQNEATSDLILLKLDYNTSTRKLKIKDKIRISPIIK